MSLKQKLQTDLKEAFKSGDANRKSVVGMLISAVKSREIEKRSKLAKSGAESDAAKLDEMAKLTDEEVIEVVGSEIKKRKESIAQYEGGGRPELAAQEKSEITVLMAYLPEQMSESEIRDLAQKAIAETGASGAKDMGKVLGSLMPKVKGKADGQTVSAIVKELLG